MNEIKPDKNAPTKAINIFALLGFAIFIAVAIWSSYQIIKLAPSFFNSTQKTEQTIENSVSSSSQDSSFWSSIFSLFSSNKEYLRFNTTPESVKEGEPFTISWTLNTKKEGILSFSYACVPGLTLKLPATAHSTEKSDVQVDEKNSTAIPCNSAFALPAKLDKLTFIPELEQNESVVLKYAIAYTYKQPEKDSRLLQDIASTVVKPKKEIQTSEDDLRAIKNFVLDNKGASNQSQSTTTHFASTSINIKITGDKQKNLKTSTDQKSNQAVIKNAPIRQVMVTVPPVNNPNGLADLSVDWAIVGAIDSYGNFVPKGTVAPYEKIAIKFQVSNKGDKETGPWTYHIDLPTVPHYIYASKIQPSILPGGNAIVVVTFNQPRLGYVNALIQVDKYNLIPEMNETNNSKTIYFTVTHYNQY